ncbi:hypothetical protein PAESOLCIP111_06617 [Paenibacillus solanacearum]|uniref:Uncharacterized protein n=1 Tax=Paenibacillus solanacearum TaxID=2048548 RepID=A0A916K9H1_9BACL|nr:hypothetical protein [Paenibacillus solanacearum]CAG7652749.1 hypothetical protein PAESOLCIP111_06617 [Paenibacillus solanacearum]
MILSLVISWEDFDNYIDFSEARLFFNSSFETMNSFSAWGITILKASECYSLIKQKIDFKDEVDLYISGLTKVRFKEIQSGSISIALYNQNGNQFIKDNKNDIIRISKQWGNAEESDTRCIEFYTTTDWPYGFGDLKLQAAGDIELIIETDFVIPVQEYIRDGFKYGYKKNK